jgi:hypothetical protein
VGKPPVPRESPRRLSRDEAGSLVKLVIARYNMRYGKPINSTTLSQLLFLALYTTRRNNTLVLLRRPRARFPVPFRLLNMPYLPIDQLLMKVGINDVVGANGGYVTRDPGNAFKGAYSELTGGGLKDLADYATWVVDEYGKYSEDSLVELSTRVLGLSPFIRAMAFNMSLDAFLRARAGLRRALVSGGYVDEEELYPELFRGSGS